MALELILAGRIVKGHPMKPNQKIDDNNRPITNPDGTPKMEWFMAFAVPKTGETDFKLSAWGSQLAAQAAADFPSGESKSPHFSWKVVDGDSQIPNKNGNVPAQQEGHPGHWVLQLRSNFAYPCHHFDKLMPLQAIKEAGEIQTGDYGRVLLNCLGNGIQSKTKGMYLNVGTFVLDRKGEAIASASQVDVMAKFGGTQPSNAPVATAGATPPPPPPPPPARDIVDGPKTYNVSGTEYTAQQLLDVGYTQAQLDAM